MSPDLHNVRTFVDVIRRRAERASTRRAITYLRDGEDDAVVLTYGDLDHRARAIAGQLQEHGLAAGQRALLMYPQSVDYLTTFLGCLYAGVIAVPLYPPHLSRPERTLPTLRAIARDCGATAALVPTTGLAGSASVADLAPEIANLRWLVTDEATPALADRWRDPGVTDQTVALLQYTSGSTSTPKGVVIDHGNLVHNELMLATAFGHDETSTLVSWLPLFHDMGLTLAALQALFVGAEAVLMPPVAFVQRPVRWLQAISRYRAHTSGGPNFGYDLCTRKVTAQQREGLDLESWRLAFNGAEPVRQRTLDAFAKAFRANGFRPRAWYPCYGLAEITVFGTGGQAADLPVVRHVDVTSLEAGRVVEMEPGPGSRAVVGCGRARLDRRTAIVDPDSRHRVPEGQVGEIWLAGADVARGYWGRPDESELTFRARLADDDEGPYLRTGDLGFMLDGELYVAGRLKDLIIVAGRNHYPQDLELTVEGSHPGIRSGCSAAFAIEADDQERLIVVAEVEREYRPRQSEEPYASTPRLDALIQAVRQSVAEEHDVRVQEVVLIRPASIPKTSSGKIRRGTCRTLLLSGQLDDVIVARSNHRAAVAAGRNGQRIALERAPSITTTVVHSKE
jgi:acyl-CoA synthetase (AMP-forming)/AMP-acid ligase II